MKPMLVPLLAGVIVLQTTSSQQFQIRSKFSKRNGESSIVPTLDLSNMDPSTPPLEDFYQFVNGGWLKRNSIPSENSKWNCFEEVTKRNNIVLKKILEDAAQTSGDPIGDMFNSGMDEKAIDESGLEEISDLIAGIESIQNEQDIVSFLGSLHSEGLGYPFFSLNPSPDSRNSSHVLAHLSQGGLGLPNRDYYFAYDKATLRQTYQKHIQNMFTLANETFPEQCASDVYQIELFLANASMTILESRDPIKTYNKVTYADLKSLSPINWDDYFTNLGLTPNGFGDIVIDHPPFFTSLHEAFFRFNLPQVQNYLKWFVLRTTYPFLPKPFQEEGFQFYRRILTGQQQPKPRWERVKGTISATLGDLLSKRFAEEVFPPHAKKQVMRMVELLQDALRERIVKLDWMEESTKEKALEKLNKLSVKIGYPDQWEDYSDLKLNSSRSFLYNVRQTTRRALRNDFEDINKEVKRWQWAIPTYQVNAYYNPQLNEIVFPAGILQPPFFFPPKDPSNIDDVAFNFGGIGMVIGHELTHGYDDQGRQFDSNGNLVDWWTEIDSNNFKKRAETIIHQFNELTFFNKSVNGELTQGENIADLGGVKISYIAFQNWMKHHGEPKDVHGFSPNQQFFIAYGQLWRNLITQEAALLLMASDPHPPGFHRVNQPLSNMQEFYDAFGEPNTTQGMYKEKKSRVQIW